MHEPDLGDAEARALRHCVAAGDASGHSPTTIAFERSFAARVGVEHAIATSSGTASLHLAFAALGLGAGDEVIVPSFTFAPCADMVGLTGAMPVLVDADPATFNLTPSIAAAAITPATRAVLAVHLYGHPCDLTGLRALCDEHAIALVEDCAQALGAQHRGRPVGSFGAIACYSFYANKVITTGEGGMVTTDDAELAARLRSLRSHAQVADEGRPYLHTELGFNYRLSAFAASVGLAQLGRLDAFLDRKARNADRYRDALSGCRGVTLPATTSGADRHAHWAYAILVDPAMIDGGAGGLAAHLRAHGCETRRFYHPLHLHPGAEERSIIRGSLPRCEAFAPTGLVLPSGNTLASGQVDAVVDRIRSYVDG